MALGRYLILTLAGGLGATAGKVSNLKCSGPGLPIVSRDGIGRLVLPPTAC